MPCAVGEHLHLDVPRALDEPLEQQGVVAERGAATRRADASAAGSSSAARTTCMPLPPPPADGLTSSGKPTPAAAAMSAASSRPGARLPGTTGTPRARDVLLRADLVAHRLERVRRPAR